MDAQTLLLILAGVALLFVWLGWYGSNVIMHPPRPAAQDTFPRDYGLEAEDFTCVTEDGISIAGWWIPPKNGPAVGTVFVVHGWGDNKHFVLPHCQFLAARERFNLVIFDCRACGDSEGAHGSIGFLEARDFDAVWAWMTHHHPEALDNLGIFGSSMGGAVAIRQAALRPEIKCAFILNTFTSYEGVITQYAWNHYRVPKWPLVSWAYKVTEWRVGGDGEAHSPILFVDKIAPRPFYLVHGTHDDLMPLGEAKTLMAKAGEPKKLWIVPGAAHGKCWEAAPEEFERRCTAFFNEHLAKVPHA